MNLDRIIAVRNDKTVFRDGNRCYKVFDESHHLSDIMSEARNQIFLEEAGIKVPGFLEITQVNGKWAIVTEFIGGKTLDELMAEHPEKTQEYFEMFIDLQISVHARTGRLLSRLEDQLAYRVNNSDLLATTRYFLLSGLEDMQRHVQICHGDFIPSNIIVAEDGTPYIVDCALAALGNPLADVARTYLLFWMRGKIDSASVYLDRYCEKTDTPREKVLEWMPIAAASQYAKCNEREREFLLSWINKVHKN